MTRRDEPPPYQRLTYLWGRGDGGADLGFHRPKEVFGLVGGIIMKLSVAAAGAAGVLLFATGAAAQALTPQASVETRVAISANEGFGNFANLDAGFSSASAATYREGISNPFGTSVIEVISGRSSARADLATGSLGAEAQSMGSPSGGFSTASGLASMQDSFQLIAPEDYTESSALVTMAFLLHGERSSLGGPSDHSTLDYDVTLRLAASSQLLTSIRVHELEVAGAPVDFSTSLFNAEQADSGDPLARLYLSTFVVPLNQVVNFSSSLFAQTNLNAQLLFGQTATAQMTLPEGFTYTSASGVFLTDTAGGVPEPAAWALMILGLGGAGAALRRRRLSAGPAFVARGN
jgi:hypothetical protein